MTTKCPKDGCSYESSKTGVKIHYKKKHGESIAGFKYSCAWCGESVVKTSSQYEKAFCSSSCEDSWQSKNWSGENNPNYQGKTLTLSCNYCGSEFKRHESQTKSNRGRYCSKSCKAKDKTGKESPAWKEINAESERFTTFERGQILNRDDYTCQECNATSKALHAHHIKPSSDNPELAHDIENGITLCIDCHAQKHDEPIRSFVLSQKS